MTLLSLNIDTHEQAHRTLQINLRRLRRHRNHLRNSPDREHEDGRHGQASTICIP